MRDCLSTSRFTYKADPVILWRYDPIEIDLAKLPAGTKNMYVKDLKLEEKRRQCFHIALGS